MPKKSRHKKNNGINRYAVRFGIEIPRNLHGLGDLISWVEAQLAEKRQRVEAQNARHAVTEGQFLLIVKEEIRLRYGKANGHWGQCMKRLANYDARTAQRYMRLAKSVSIDDPLICLGQERLVKLIQKQKEPGSKKLRKTLKADGINPDIDVADREEVLGLKAAVDNLLKAHPRKAEEELPDTMSKLHDSVNRLAGCADRTLTLATSVMEENGPERFENDKSFNQLPDRLRAVGKKVKAARQTLTIKKKPDKLAFLTANRV